MATLVFSAAQRDHSKLQKPLHVAAPESGMAAAATNAQRQERTAADVTRACSWSRPRRLRRRAKARRFLSACEGSWAAISQKSRFRCRYFCDWRLNFGDASLIRARRARERIKKPRAALAFIQWTPDSRVWRPCSARDSLEQNGHEKWAARRVLNSMSPARLVELDGRSVASSTVPECDNFNALRVRHQMPVDMIFNSSQKDATNAL